jgi:hypothetical protein
MAIPAAIPQPALDKPTARSAETPATTATPSLISPLAIPTIPLPGA